MCVGVCILYRGLHASGKDMRGDDSEWGRVRGSRLCTTACVVTVGRALRQFASHDLPMQSAGWLWLALPVVCAFMCSTCGCVGWAKGVWHFGASAAAQCPSLRNHIVRGLPCTIAPPPLYHYLHLWRALRFMYPTFDSVCVCVCCQRVCAGEVLGSSLQMRQPQDRVWWGWVSGPVA